MPLLGGRNRSAATAVVDAATTSAGRPFTSHITLTLVTSSAGSFTSPFVAGRAGLSVSTHRCFNSNKRICTRKSRTQAEPTSTASYQIKLTIFCIAGERAAEGGTENLKPWATYNSEVTPSHSHYRHSTYGVASILGFAIERVHKAPVSYSQLLQQGDGVMASSARVHIQCQAELLRECSLARKCKRHEAGAMHKISRQRN